MEHGTHRVSFILRQCTGSRKRKRYLEGKSNNLRKLQLLSCVCVCGLVYICLRMDRHIEINIHFIVARYDAGNLS